MGTDIYIVNKVSTRVKHLYYRYRYGGVVSESFPDFDLNLKPAKWY